MRSDDSAAVLSIFQQGIDGGNATFDEQVPVWAAWDSAFLKQGRWVLENAENVVIGWAGLKPVSNRACFSGVAEVSVYVGDHYQGKGLASILLRKLILDSEEHGFWTLQSGIFPENLPSIAVHQKLGFREVGRREKIGKMNGSWRDIILMERRSRVVGIS